MMFMSVLTLWGQTDSLPNSDETIDIQDVKIEFLTELVEMLDTISGDSTLHAQLYGPEIDELEKIKDTCSIENFDQKFDDVLYPLLTKIISTNKIKIGDTKSITIWILLAISSLGLIIAIISIVVISRINIEIKKRKEEIVKLEKLVSNLKKDLLVLSNRFKPNVAKSTNAPQTINLSESPVEKIKPVVVTDKKEQKQPPQPVQEKSSVYYLFATAKAGSNYPEFYNVSRDKTLYKVYMLMLKNEEDEIAEFTIVPDMTPDFMKSVIDDRETHLPPIFCERSIDAQNPTRIEVVSTGIAKKEGGKWTVQERMKIKLV